MQVFLKLTNEARKSFQNLFLDIAIWLHSEFYIKCNNNKKWPEIQDNAQ